MKKLFVTLNEFDSVEEIATLFSGAPYYETPKEKDAKENILAFLEGCQFIFASYGSENYLGDAFVLMKKDGAWYEVDGSHCSCNGLEGQWEPEVTNLVSIHGRIFDGTLGTDDYSGNVFKTELIAFLIEIEEYQGLTKREACDAG